MNSMKKSKLIYVIYLILILSITAIFSIQIFDKKISKPQQSGKIIEPIINIKEIPIDEFLIYSLKEQQETEKKCEYEERNNLGFKDFEWQIQKPSNTYRIITLGDSMTVGLCVRNEYTWPKQLEGKLNDLNFPIKLEVFNMGSHELDTGTSEELGTLKNFSLKYNPNMIILEYYNNDWVSLEIKAKAKELWNKYQKGEYKLPPTIEKEVEKLNASKTDISGILYGILWLEYFKTANLEEEWDKWVAPYLTEIIEICRDKNIKLIIITWDSDQHQMDKLIPILKNYSIPFYDFSNYLPWRPCPSNTRLPDCHLTPLGYEIVTNRTLDVLLKKLNLS